MREEKLENHCHSSGGSTAWVVGLVACLLVLFLGAPVAAQTSVELDKQVSCDAGQTWHDAGYSDGGFTGGCTGWFDSTDPQVGREIRVRYLARTSEEVSACVLTDSNPAVLGSVAIGDLLANFNGVIHTTELLECNSELLSGEPNTGTLDCTSSSTDSPVSSSDTAEVQSCQEATVDVVKECAANNGDGTYTYDVKVTNTGTAPLEGCFLEDDMAVCGPLSATDLAPGEMATTSCTGDQNMNMAKVTCFIAGTQKPVMDEAMAACVDVDKQVSCQNGDPGTFVDVGYNDNIAEKCTGWATPDPNDPAGREIVFRYLVRTGGAMTQCSITESNPAIGPVSMPANLPAKFDDEVFRTQIGVRRGVTGRAG